MNVNRKQMRYVCLLVALLVVCVTSRSAAAAPSWSPHLVALPDASGPAPILTPEVKYRSVSDGRIPDEYIVVLSDDVLPAEVPQVARDLGISHQFTPRKVWKDGLKGFSARMPEALARALSNNPHVKYVEENAEWHLSDTGTQQTNVNPVTCNPTLTICTGNGIVTDNRLWHLDRADQNYPDPTNTYSYCTDGTGITVYVVDTGVNKNHQEFGSRVMSGYNATARTADPTTADQMPADDPCLGFAVPPNPQFSQDGINYFNQVIGDSHGTAVASALGGARVGIAKNVTIVPIKVRRCDLDSSRVRLSDHSYAQNQTMYRTANSSGYDALYRCISNGGRTAVSDPGGWSTTPGATITDGTVTWKVLDPDDYRSFASTDMLIDGLLWILSAANPGPKSYAIVTLSQYRRAEDIFGTRFNTTVETVVRSLLNNNITVIASANNQNGNACDTSPSRISINNPDAPIRGDVITAGGSMLINRPWNVNLSEPPAIPFNATEADGQGVVGITKGTEIPYNSAKAVREGRWICGEGDSDFCSNATVSSTPPPTAVPPDPRVSTAYYTFLGGSNAGACVTLFAPAKNLFLATTTGNGSDYRDARLHGAWASGTSWSAPIVAGFAARLLQGPANQGPNQLTPAQVRTALLSNSVATLEDSDQYPLNTVDSGTGLKITGTPNKLLRLSDVNITQQPASQSVTSSETPTLTVQAAGTSAVSYQWYRVNADFDLAHWTNGAHFDTGGVGSVTSSSTKITGATTSTYQAPASSVTTGYWVRASNSCGSADTNIAVVTIIACVAPSITTQPQSVSVPSGTGVRLSVGASGSFLSYQWFVGSTGVTTTPVAGGTGTTVDVTPAATTTYWVRVTNTCGTSDSAAATVTVTPIVAASFYVVPPCRIVDTRGGGAIPGSGVKNVNVIGACLVPAGVKSIAANVTVLNPPQLAFLAMYPGPSNTLPVGVTVNFQAGQTIANNARLTVGTDGSINFRNAATAPLDFILDISGYFK